ncbi:acyl-CoA dehydrogenase family protein [soil metagenome]
MITLPLFEDRHRALHARLQDVRAQLEPIAARGEASDVDEAGRDAIRVCADLDLCRLLVPTEFGGDGLDLRSLCIVREALAAGSGLVDAVFAVQGLGSYPIGLSGNRAMAERYLPSVASGRSIAAFALTEPQAGSDASALATTARREGDAYVLDGAKIFISNATIASHFVVFARTAEGTRRAITAFVVDGGAPGLTVTRRQEMSAPHPIAALRFSGCRVSSANRLGEEGDGMRLALGTLDFFRTSVGAAACGLAARALEESVTYAQGRTQFGSALADFQLTQAALADMATELDAARLLVARAAWTKDQEGARVPRESGMAKLFATEAAQRIVDRAVQIHGGRGVERGSVVERLYREVRALRIYEGTSEIQRLVIARSLLGH